MAVPADARPDLDRLLKQQDDTTDAVRRGRLRIYFGASAGVGKTYAMLSAARVQRDQGVDVVAGVVETHGRRETAELVEGLEFLPPQRISYRDRTLQEFDLPGAGMTLIRVLLRRRARDAANAADVDFGDVHVDLARRIVVRAGLPVHLTQIEYRLLATLLAQRGKVLTHRELLRAVWGPSHVESNHYLRIYMGHLRQKLEADPAQPVYLLTEIGVGYRFAA